MHLVSDPRYPADQHTRYTRTNYKTETEEQTFKETYITKIFNIKRRHLVLKNYEIKDVHILTFNIL